VSWPSTLAICENVFYAPTAGARGLAGFVNFVLVPLDSEMLEIIRKKRHESVGFAHEKKDDGRRCRCVRALAFGLAADRWFVGYGLGLSWLGLSWSEPPFLGWPPLSISLSLLRPSGPYRCMEERPRCVALASGAIIGHSGRLPGWDNLLRIFPGQASAIPIIT
jgi:hypothetical protein